jgi:hypothetical protein
LPEQVADVVRIARGGEPHNGADHLDRVDVARAEQQRRFRFLAAGTADDQHARSAVAPHVM